nr:MAG TPA: hypothetical protein [Caudoviricetes sp.]
MVIFRIFCQTIFYLLKIGNYLEIGLHTKTTL